MSAYIDRFEKQADELAARFGSSPRCYVARDYQASWELALKLAWSVLVRKVRYAKTPEDLSEILDLRPAIALRLVGKYWPNQFSSDGDRRYAQLRAEGKRA